MTSPISLSTKPRSNGRAPVKPVAMPLQTTKQQLSPKRGTLGGLPAPPTASSPSRMGCGTCSSPCPLRTLPTPGCASGQRLSVPRAFPSRPPSATCVASGPSASVLHAWPALLRHNNTSRHSTRRPPALQLQRPPRRPHQQHRRLGPFACLPRSPARGRQQHQELAQPWWPPTRPTTGRRTRWSSR